MSRRPHASSTLASLTTLALGLAACDSTPATTTDAGPSGEVDAATEPGTDTGPSEGRDAFVATDDAAARSDAGPQPGFDVPRDRTWHYVELPGAECANGSTLGIGLNLDPSADRVVVFLQGGGACWDVATCVLLDTASHLNDTLDEATVLGEARSAGGFILDREDATNPYRDQSYVYVPYCTGDVHAGDTVTDYSTPRTMASIHHRGAHNVELVLSRLATTLPALDRVTMAGESAGGYGVTVNAFRARLAFPDARVDVLDDSGILVDADPEQWAQMMASWRPPLPADCPECLERVTNLIPYYERTMRPGERFAVLASREDETIRTYFNYSPDTMAMLVDAMAEDMATTTHHRAYVVNGSQHVHLRRSAPEAVRSWVTAFATDDPSWDNVVP
jgi:hypothetical protein